LRTTLPLPPTPAPPNWRLSGKAAPQDIETTPFLAHKMDMASAMTYNELGVVLESGVKMSQLNVFDYGQAGVSMLEDGLYARGDYLKAHPDVAVKFLKASILGWQDVVKDPAGAAQIVVDADQSGQAKLAHQAYMAKEVVKLLWWGHAKTYGIGYMDPAAYQRTVKQALQFGVIKKTPSGAYTQTYWKQAIAALAKDKSLMLDMSGMKGMNRPAGGGGAPWGAATLLSYPRHH